ncbi:taste receptor type 1 member 3 isoform X2 [Numida meleagris]|uniref:taste receptor type 1 member 3 isoform X2 n=1 Tax=Numida meleagris TaxID=8996 RepID=UPI000B3D9024|nr:taste receptor type 1 member 3 isoform X2 [Numida meleagris]
MIPGLLLCVSFGYAAALKPTCLSAQFRRPGDFVIGGLFPFGMDTINLTARSEPTLIVCERLFVDGLIWALGMKFAIDEINNSTSLLPGVELGYDIYDTCFEPLAALQPSLLFVTRNGTTGIGVACNYTDYQPRVAAVIGPHKSDLCLLTAQLFSFFLIPQVSYGASSEKLSNKELYPSFYRTVPSDKNLVEAVVLLLNEFGWNWIATIGSDDEYGRGAQELFLSTIGNGSICIAYEGLIPSDLTDPKAKKQMEETIEYINKTNVNIIVLFAFRQPAQALLEQSIKMGLSKKVWIGTEPWLLSDITTSIPNIQNIGTVLGFILKASTVPGFQKYIANLLSSVQQDEFCQESREFYRRVSSDVLGTQCKQCDHISFQDISSILSHSQIQPVYIAVYSVAYALHRALGCTHQGCPKASIRSQQLLHFMNTVPFTVNGQSFRFDESHGTNTGYKLIFWHWENGSLTHLLVGDYQESLNLNKSLIQFHTADQKEPTSECFRECEPGQIRQIKGFHLCCYDCTDCPENTYCSSKGCKQQGSSTPLQRARHLLTTTLQTAPPALPAWSTSGPLPGARSATTAARGKPSNNLCVMQQIVYALCLNACLSTFFTKSLEIVLLTEFPRCARSALRWVRPSRAWLLVALCLLTECLFCFCYLHLGPDYVLPDYSSLPTEVLLTCSTASWLAFALMHGYNGCLAFVCFLCTFMVQTSGKKYNIARGITFAILIYFIVWIFFVAIFATLRTVFRSVIQIGTILMVSLGIVGTYYIPKCYILLLKPDLNREDYFQYSTQEEPEGDPQ